MPLPWSSRRLALPLAGASAAILVAMTIVSMVTGASQEVHEWYRPPAAYAASLLAHPDAEGPRDHGEGPGL